MNIPFKLLDFPIIKVTHPVEVGTSAVGCRISIPIDPQFIRGTVVGAVLGIPDFYEMTVGSSNSTIRAFIHPHGALLDHAARAALNLHLRATRDPARFYGPAP